MKKFSVRHRLHFLLILLYGLQVESIFHWTWKGLFTSLSVHMCFDSSVWFLRFAFRNEVVWFLYLSLKLVASPTYDSFVVSVVTVAWYITFSWRQFPCSGHSSLFLQLHVRWFCVGTSVLLSGSCESIFLLWDEMMDFIFGMQE